MPSNPFSDRDPAVSVSVGADTDRFGSAIDGAISKLGDFKTAVGATGAALATLGGAALGKSVSAFADFDSAMQESVAVMGDVDEAMRTRLEETAREVASSTTRSHQEAAESFYFLASAGLNATSSMEAMPEVAALAEAGQMDMAQATDYATDIMSAFGKEASELGSVTDSMTATVTRHNQTMKGMGEAMSMVAPIASGLGMSIEETSAAIGVMGDAGIKGSRAGRTLRQALNRLSSPTKAMQETLDELGVSVRDSEGNMRSMTAILGDLEEAGATTTDVMDLFGARAGPGMQVLLDEGAEAIETETEQIREMEGVTEDVAETQRQTLNRQLEIFRSRLNDVGVAIGSAFEEPLTGLLGTLNDAASDLTTLIERTGKVRVALGLAGGTVGALATSVGLLGSGPLGLLIGAIGTLGAAAATNFGNVRDVADDALGVVTEAARLGNRVLGDFAAALNIDASPFTDVEDTVADVVGGVEDALARAKGVLEKAGADWTAHSNDVTGAAVDAYDTAQETVDTAMSSVSGHVSDALDAARSAWAEHAPGIEQAASNAFSDAASAVDDAMLTLETHVSTGVETVESTWEEHAGDVKRVVDDATDFVVSNPSDALTMLATTVVPGPLGTIQDAFRRNWGKIEETVSTAITEIEKTLGTVSETLDTQLLQPLLNAESDTRKTFSSMVSEVDQSFGLIRGTISKTLGIILDEFIRPTLREMGELWRQHLSGEDGIVHNARGLFGTLESIVSIGLDGILTTVNVILDLLSGDFEGAWNNIAGFVERTINEITEWLSTSAVSLFDGAVGAIVSAVKAPFEQLYDWLIGNSLFKDLIYDSVDWLKTAGKDALEGAAEKMVNAVGSVFTAISFDVDWPEPPTIVKKAVNGNLSIDWPSPPDPVSDAVDTVTGGGGSGDDDDDDSGGGGGGNGFPGGFPGGLPGLDTGGRIEQAGAAILHAGERVVPAAEVDRGGADGAGGMQVTIEKIEASGYQEGREAGQAFLEELDSNGI
jgi:TP901 family phage tail tape measure protein